MPRLQPPPKCRVIQVARPAIGCGRSSPEPVLAASRCVPRAWCLLVPAPSRLRRLRSSAQSSCLHSRPCRSRNPSRFGSAVLQLAVRANRLLLLRIHSFAIATERLISMPFERALVCAEGVQSHADAALWCALLTRAVPSMHFFKQCASFPVRDIDCFVFLRKTHLRFRPVTISVG